MSGQMKVNKMCNVFLGLIATVALLITIAILDTASGHGMVMNPVARGSRWRFDSKAPINYNDNSNFCGGFYAQHELNSGKCGLCGDDYGLPKPRPHELGGAFGQGVIVKSYQRGARIPVSVLITANHKGHFYFNLCDLQSYGTESEQCFQKYPLKTTAGSLQHYLDSTDTGYYNLTLQLPTTLTCNRCVLQWTYHVGNSWGFCSDGTGKLGCGPQENFRTCSDIEIK